MARVAAYVDGLNLYHGLKEKGWNKFYWLDIPGLIRSYLREDTLVAVYYFTTLALNAKSYKRQTTYLEALHETSRKSGVVFITQYGVFKPDEIRCNICGDWAFCKACDEQLIFQHEKQTDVNISVRMLSDAYEDNYDTAYLVTGDSDQVGTINTIKKYFGKSKNVVVLIPPERKADELVAVADAAWNITPQKLGKYQLPSSVTKLADGYELKRPAEWI